MAPITELFGLSRMVAFLVFFVIAGMLCFAFFWFFHSAPPRKITITSGVAGSGFETNAYKYQRILARSGVQLTVLNSKGSLENLERLRNPAGRVDIGFVQSGMTNVPEGRELTSLGSVSSQPLIIFYRSETNLEILSAFKGKRIAIGPLGSGTHYFGAPLLATNGVDAANSTLLDLEADEASNALIEGKVDAVLLMGDSASPQVMRRLFQASNLKIFDVKQADAYTRKFGYLNKLTLPRGGIDFGKDIPARDAVLVGPSVELLARADLHPALIDLLLEAAREVHGSPGLFRKKGEFPTPVEHDYPINTEAERFYKSGRTFLYSHLPFWLASVVNRVLVVFLPLIVVLIPGLKMLPTVLRLGVRLQIYRWYRSLLAIDRELRHKITPEERERLLERLEAIQRGANHMKVPASFADQFYSLRTHIGMVRDQLTRAATQ